MEKRNVPTFECILDGDYVYAKLDELIYDKSKEETIDSSRVQKQKSGKFFRWYRSIVRYVYWVGMLVLSSFFLDAMVMTPVEVHDTIKSRKVIVDDRGTEIMSVHKTEAGRHFHAYQSITSAGGKVLIFESQIFKMILDVHTKAGSRRKLLLTGMNSFSGIIYVLTFLAIFYAFVRLHKIRETIKTDEIGILFLGPILMMLISSFIFFTVN